MRSLVFVVFFLHLVAKGRNFYSNYDNAQRVNRGLPGDGGEWMNEASCCRVYGESFSFIGG